jgi:hypothetical protein
VEEPVGLTGAKEVEEPVGLTGAEEEVEEGVGLTGAEVEEAGAEGKTTRAPNSVFPHRIAILPSTRSRLLIK